MASSEMKPGVGMPIPGDQPSSKALAPLLGVCIAFTVINTLFFLARFLTVLKLRARRIALAWDDWLLIPAYLCNIAICVIGFVMQHIEDKPYISANEVIIDPTKDDPILKCIFAILQFVIAAYSLTRLSILVLFLRIFQGKWTRRICYFMIAFVIAQWIAYAIACIMQCTPPRFFWLRAYGEASPVQGHCYDINDIYRALTPPSMASDVVLIALPLPTVWRLKSSPMRKVGLTIVFSSGFVALIGSIIRQVEFDIYSAHTLVPVITNVLIAWLVVEPGLYFITACLPALQPLLRFLLPSNMRNRAAHQLAIKESTSRSRGSGHGGDFARLVDSEGAYSGGAPGGTSKAWGGIGSPVVNQQRANSRMDPAYPNQSRKQQNNDVPLRDLRAMTEGEGVLVTKEIIVTQEQRIEDVIGF